MGTEGSCFREAFERLTQEFIVNPLVRPTTLQGFIEKMVSAFSGASLECKNYALTSEDVDFAASTVLRLLETYYRGFSASSAAEQCRKIARGLPSVRDKLCASLSRLAEKVSVTGT
ncbi:MAG: hypothetical protein QXU97_01150 [Fervidicoccaceae archaeon]